MSSNTELTFSYPDVEYNNNFFNSKDSPLLIEVSPSSLPPSFSLETILEPWRAAKSYLYSLKKYLFCPCTQERAHDDDLDLLLDEEDGLKDDKLREDPDCSETISTFSEDVMIKTDQKWDLEKVEPLGKDRKEEIKSQDKVNSLPIKVLAESSKALPKLGVLWDCIKSTKQQAPAEGTLLTFQMNPHFKNLDLQSSEAKAQLLELFPANEPKTFYLARKRLRAAPTADKEEFHFLRCLGYNIQSPDLIILPDSEALLSNWRKLQEERLRETPELPPLPDLMIFSSHDVASDLEYVEAYLSHGALLSSGKEFVHDHFFHLIPLLLAMRKPGWAEYRALAVKLVQNAKVKISQAEAELERERGSSKAKEIDSKIDLKIRRLHRVLGIYTDLLAAQQLPLDNLVEKELFGNIGHFFELHLTTWPTDKKWRNFWKRKEGQDLSEKDIAEITNLLKTKDLSY